MLLVASRLKGYGLEVSSQGFAQRNGFHVRHVLGNSPSRKSRGRETAVLRVRFDVLVNNVSSRHKGESLERRRSRLHRGNTSRRGVLTQEIARRWERNSHPVACGLDMNFRRCRGYCVNISSEYCASMSLSTGNINSDYFDRAPILTNIINDSY